MDFAFVSLSASFSACNTHPAFAGGMLLLQSCDGFARFTSAFQVLDAVLQHLLRMIALLQLATHCPRDVFKV